MDLPQIVYTSSTLHHVRTTYLQACLTITGLDYNVISIHYRLSCIYCTVVYMQCSLYCFSLRFLCFTVILKDAVSFQYVLVHSWNDNKPFLTLIDPATYLRLVLWSKQKGFVHIWTSDLLNLRITKELFITSCYSSPNIRRCNPSWC